jgi:surface protein
MSEFRRRLIAVKKEELKKNEVLAVYDVTTTESKTLLLDYTFALSNITKMKIGGIEVTPTNTHIFNEIGEITVIMTINPNATSLNNMFKGSRLKSVDMSKFQALSVTSMTFMFSGCTALTAISLFDTRNVTNMQQMFKGCTALTAISLFDTRNVTNMQQMFMDCKKLNGIPLLNTSKVTNMNSIFYGCIALTTIPLFDTRNAQMSALFGDCTKLESIPQIDTSGASTMYWLFRNCHRLTTVPLLDATKVTTAPAMFDNCRALQNFGGLKNLSSVDLSLSSSSKLTPLSIHNIIEQALGNFTLILNATAKTNWQNSQYYEADQAMATEKNITIQ